MAEVFKRPRPPDSKEDDQSDEEIVGPMPASEESEPKKRKVLDFEKTYLSALPAAKMYEISFMHRDTITHVTVTKTDFIVTASCDGHVKFWKKQETGIEFVKHFRAHIGSIEGLCASADGLLTATIASDKALKVFDVINFDMINMFKLGYVPGCCEWIYPPGAPIAALAVSKKDAPVIQIFDGKGENTPIHVLDSLHGKPCQFIKYNSVHDTVVSGDSMGMIEYWTGPTGDYKFPSQVDFEFKTDTDLYGFVKVKAIATSLSFSSDGNLFVTMATDRKVRVFRFLSGRLFRVFDESLATFTEIQKTSAVLPDMDFSRRIALEKDLDKALKDQFALACAVFDDSGNFILYPTMLGIKVVNLCTNKCVRMLGKEESIRFLQLSLYQGKLSRSSAALTMEMQASDNPGLQQPQSDPTLFCTALKKNRFYMMTQREPDHDSKGAGSERDVFNEKPTKEEQMSATTASTEKRVSETAVMHTTLGDIHVKLFPKECPKTVENFCVHSREGYFNGIIFHRVIKGFMIQTGDPKGDGTGGESIWGSDFEDEFDRNLRHDRAYTMSMANAGPNTNGAQFFITVMPTPWLDNKHTVFGRVTGGMEVVHKISNVKTNPRSDRPYDEVRLVSVTIK